MFKKISILTLLITFALNCAGTQEKEITKANNPTESEEEPAQIICKNIVININKLPNRRVAVADFTDIEGNDSVEGKLLSEQIITYLAQNTNVKVIERKQLNNILEEQKLTMLGLTESDNAQKIGKLLNVDALISGTIAHLEDTKEINARMVDVNTGLILCAVPVKTRTHQREMKMEHLSEPEREKLKQEIAQREQERKKEPELFRLKVQHRKELLNLKEKDPKIYFKVIETINIMEKLKKDNPRLFLLVTEPPRSAKIQQLQKKNPEIFQKVQELRKRLKFITDNSPAYLKKLLKERRKIIKEQR